MTLFRNIVTMEGAAMAEPVSYQLQDSVATITLDDGKGERPVAPDT